MLLDFSDLNADIYKIGWLPVHVTAFRPRPGNVYYDVIVTDYSRPNTLVLSTENLQMELAAGTKALLKMSFQMFSGLADAYHDRAHQDLFQASDVCPETSAWVDISGSFCFASLRIQLQVGEPPYVKWVALILRPSRQFSRLWERFITAVSGHILLNKPLILRLTEACLTGEEQSLLDAAVGDSTSYSTEESQNVPPANFAETHIKDESDAENTEICQETLHAQQQFLSSLESAPYEGIPTGRFFRGNIGDIDSTFPAGISAATAAAAAAAGPPGPPGPTPATSASQESQELLTQVPVFPSQSQINTAADLLENTQSQGLLVDYPSFPEAPSLSLEGQSQDDLSLADVYALQESGNVVSLAALKQVPLVEDFRAFKVKTKIVGTFPDDLMYVCTKTYFLQNGITTTGDPVVRAFELLLLDTHAKTVTPHNSLRVHVPQKNVLAFFGCKYVEQLYTEMEAKKAEFAKLYSSAITLEMSVGYAGGPVMWVLNDLSRMSELINELV